MTLTEAYDRLGFVPLDQFLHGNQDPDRRIGATTWMLVEAALTAMKGKDVLIVGHNLAYARHLVGEIWEFMPSLTGGRKDGIGAIVAGSSNSQKRVRGPHQVFDDLDYRNWAVARRKGPYQEIRLLKTQVDGSFRAFDGRGEYILDLDAEGGREISGDMRIRVIPEDFKDFEHIPSR